MDNVNASVTFDLVTVAVHLRISPARVRTLLKEGKLEGEKNEANEWRFTLQNVKDYLEYKESGEVKTRDTSKRKVMGLRPGDEEAILAMYPHLSFARISYLPSEGAKERQVAAAAARKEAAKSKADQLAQLLAGA